RARPNQRVAAGDILLLVQPDSATAPNTAPRVSLPSEDETERRVRHEQVYAADRFVRERARQEIAASVRRMLLGYDTEPEEIAAVQEFFDAAIPASAGETVLREL